MPKFAIFYVPEADDELYRQGSQVLGYDVRARATLAMPASLRDQFAFFDPAWVASAQPYGFHLTIGDAIACTEAAIPLVERELEAMLLCFDPQHPWMLRQRQPDPISIWQQVGQDTIVLRYEPNDALRMLHALVVGRINPLGTGSGYLQRALAQPDTPASPARAQRTRLFYSPFVLEDWVPHFTLLNPYRGEGDDRDQIVALCAHLFGGFVALEVRSVCLMVQMHEAERWHIYRELRRPAP